MRSPHRQLRWFCSEDTLEIYYERVDGYYELYKRPTGMIVTWQTQYCWYASLMDPPPNMDQTLASIDRVDSMHIKLHSTVTLPNEIQMNFDLGRATLLAESITLEELSM